MNDSIETYGSETINSIFRDYHEYFGVYDPPELIRGLTRRTRYAREWSLFLQEYPLVLSPFLPHPTYKWDRDTEGIDGVIEVIGSSVYGYAMNFVGLPAGNIAADYNDGLPVGVQIAGRRFREDLVLDACEAVERHVGVMAHRLFERG